MCKNKSLIVLKIIVIIITIIAGTPKHLIVFVIAVMLVIEIIEVMPIIMEDIRLYKQ